ncbi:Xanthosine triphosphate pyrophosphatase [Methylacidiphilum infernorum V4]|uniref:dITP/XTP pyrophosphatase n=2 Tax=Candidatus Methylacidiphilum infernorum TaxID=511746 RepID=IXTPA_METI4|nr:RecName: Full=dITP/XTP pyrophosphatase; AltName: Full=Non-canonical purine NTP pyrophosphatase; AltName: Full=Non-standard purine NTP pyrophosphatase; AltName: Full=Nucleoside-triphosphate diphosphatase; AltName: Full=Nucleoside-triphosphate pyrophosphatase; Short=NTPase [Methylacidiphilum infernorum V4]ACD83172.1 Xanthosine triphosphate pyrophosphatase [Methylacidiphilum infernorum V4]
MIMQKILLATSNRHKYLEFSRLLYPLTLEALPEDLKRLLPNETAKSYRDNAKLKGMALSEIYEGFVLADDSGLEVFSLHGEPGIFSSRYAGEGSSAQENIDKLLKNLQSKNITDRRARFVCALVLVKKKKILFETTAFCYGIIADRQKGGGGFGYDPIFIPEGYSLTMAELDEKQKDLVSHRGKACQELKAFFLENRMEGHS